MKRKWTCMTAALLLVATILAIPAAAAVRTWVGPASGQWATSSNWSPAGYSVADDLIVLSGTPVGGYITTDNGGSITLEGAAAVADFTDDLRIGYDGQARMDVLGAADVSNRHGYLAWNADSAGTMTVDGAGSTWTNNGILEVGLRGTATLAITNGGVVSNTFGYLGYESTADGSAIVSGAGSAWNSNGDLFVGHYGTGKLEITGGATVSAPGGHIGEEPDSTGKVTVSGPGSTWSSRLLLIGWYGSGTLAITGGGTVLNGTAWVGGISGSSGKVTVSGAGSMLANSDHLAVGFTGGVGELYVTDAATVSTEDELLIGWYGTGTLNVTNGGGVSNGDSGLIGWATDAVGAVTVSGAGSSWSCGSNNLYLGGGEWYNGADWEYGGTGTGTLEITDGGSVVNNHGWLGYNAGASGDVTVSGPGSSWANSGSLSVGREGTGAVSITNGAAVSNSIGYVGRSANSSGTVTVDGAGSQWSNHGNLTVGLEGTGVLTIRDGGTVSNDYGVIADDLGSSGRVTVDGPGSTWNNGNSLYVGLAGNGTLAITGGATVNNRYGVVGFEDTSSSTVTVDGAGSNWINRAGLWVGNAGTGTVAITGGATVSDSNGVLGYASSGDGTVVVSGAGSKWIDHGDLTVGREGTGVLTIRDGGEVVVDGALIVGDIDGSLGTVNLEGGSLTAASLAFDLTGGRLNWSGGSLTLTQGGLSLATETPLPAQVTLGPGRELNVAAGVDVGLLGRLAVNGGTFSAGSLTVHDGGRAQLLDGQINIRNTFTLVSDGQLEITGQTLALASEPTVRGELVLDRTTLSVPSMTVAIEGSFELHSGILTAAGDLANNGVTRLGTTGAATLRGGTLANTGVLLGQGSLQADVVNTGNIALSGDSSFTGDVTNTASGKIIVSGGSAVTFFEDVDNQAGGEIRVSQDCTATYFGKVTGNGDFTGTGTSYVEGDMRPGASPGVMAFDGDVVFGNAAGLEIELGGLDPGQYDAVNVAGTASLDGRITVSEIDTFEALPGDEFTVLTYGTRAGEFDDVDTTSMPPGLLADLFYDDSLGEAVLAFDGLAGDANLDGYVNEVDLDILATNWETTVTRGWKLGEFNDDGSIDIGDLTAMADNWQTDIFGDNSPQPFQIALFEAALARAAVPEPSTLALLACSAVVLPVLWRRRRGRRTAE